MKKVKFLFHSLRNFQEMGTVVRSGGPMCRKMTQFIDKKNDLIIMELGAGDGAITSHILNKMSPDAKLFVFEINPELCEVVGRIQDDRLILINDGAQHMEKYMQKYNISQVDTIISAIPFLVLPEELTNEILQLSRNVLKTGGQFVQMHYSKSLEKKYKSIFGNLQSYFVTFNIPPGYVFRSVKE
ncbi:MAG: methyltransferase [Saprospiraceae bacterium]|nr:methyltransferase [Saprospiraceae bacterium]